MLMLGGEIVGVDHIHAQLIQDFLQNYIDSTIKSLKGICVAGVTVLWRLNFGLRRDYTTKCCKKCHREVVVAINVKLANQKYMMSRETPNQIHGLTIHPLVRNNHGEFTVFSVTTFLVTSTKLKVWQAGRGIPGFSEIRIPQNKS